MKTTFERFNEKWIEDVDTGCWVWTASTQGDGRYGYQRINGKMVKAHRYSYEAHKGKIPEGLHVLHTCDNGLCVNPDHLWVGTHSDNMRDMIRKGRRPLPQGSNSHNSTLTEADAKAIFNSKELKSVLSRRYGITRQAIWRIQTKQTYRNIHTE